MKQYGMALFSGFLVAIGLARSGMTRPEKVTGFLDITGQWDPSLALVMAAALAVNVVVFRIVKRREKPVFAPRFALPSRKDLDVRLISGAAVFGLGWGLGGYCPGPALVGLSTGANAALFVGAMLLGMAAFRAWDEFRASGASLRERPPAPANPTQTAPVHSH
jgi:uncharacterized membrane protein YedE/YeeE